DLRTLGDCDDIIVADACDPVAVRDAVRAKTGGALADVTLSCVNVAGAQLTAVVATRGRGKVYLFSMNTGFTPAGPGAEGIGRDVDLYIGNGYAHGHAEHTLELLRARPKLHALYRARYG